MKRESQVSELEPVERAPKLVRTHRSRIFDVVNKVFTREDGSSYLIVRSRSTMRWRECPLPKERAEEIVGNIL